MDLGDLVFSYTRMRRGCTMLLLPAFVALALILFVGHYLYAEYALEDRFIKTYGADWKAHFEEKNGSLTEKRENVIIGVVGAVMVGGMAILVYRMMMPVGQITPSRRRRKRR